MTSAPSEVESTTASRSPMLAAVLTIANFALVLGGLVVIARFGSERLDTGLVNVWSIWGIAHVSIGQSLQVLAAMPGSAEATMRARLPLVLATVLLSAVAVVLLRSRLFPDLDWNWPVAAVVGIASATVSGVLRGGLVRRRMAVLSLAVVCAENAGRTLLLLVALGLGIGVADSLVPWAIVAPFLISLPVLVVLNKGGIGTEAGHSDEAQATTGRAALTMIPSLASYALLPLLSVLDRLPETIEVDALAFDAALARGPVQVAVFAAPMALQFMLDRTSDSRRFTLAAPPLLAILVVGAVLSTLLFAPESIVGRLLLVVLVGGVSLLGYAAILDAVDRSATAAVVGTVIIAAAGAFVVSANIGSSVSLAPVAWASAAAVAVLAFAPKSSATNPQVAA